MCEGTLRLGELSRAIYSGAVHAASERPTLPRPHSRKRAGIAGTRPAATAVTAMAATPIVPVSRRTLRPSMRPAPQSHAALAATAHKEIDPAQGADRLRRVGVPPSCIDSSVGKLTAWKAIASTPRISMVPASRGDTASGKRKVMCSSPEATAVSGTGSVN